MKKWKVILLSLGVITFSVFSGLGIKSFNNSAQSSTGVVQTGFNKDSNTVSNFSSAIDDGNHDNEIVPQVNPGNIIIQNGYRYGTGTNDVSNTDSEWFANFMVLLEGFSPNTGIVQLCAVAMPNHQSCNPAIVMISVESGTYIRRTGAAMNSPAPQVYMIIDGHQNLLNDNVGKVKVEYSSNSASFNFDFCGNMTLLTDLSHGYGFGDFFSQRYYTYDIVDEADVSISCPDQVWTGSALRPTVTFNSPKTLNENYWNITYSNNTNIGTATVTATGKGIYEGVTKTCTFKVKTRDISSDSVYDISSSYTYTGSAITPSFRLASISIPSSNYTYSFSNNTNVGTATLTINGRNNCTGTRTYTFRIVAKSLAADSDVSISGYGDTTYTGSEIRPSVTLYDTARRVNLSSSDYNVSYSNNTNAGTATITVTGTGNYTGTKTKTFKINPKDITNAIVTGLSTKTYTGSEITQSPTIEDPDRNATITSNNYTITYSNNTNAGTATMTITGTNNYTGTKSVTFTINRKSIVGCSVGDIGSVLYDGSAKTPGVVVTDLDRNVQISEYSTRYSNNTDAGRASVAITGTGNYTGEITKDFVINPRSVAGSYITKASIADKVYSGAEIKPGVVLTDSIGYTLREGIDYSLTYSNNVNSGTATISITGINNYAGSSTSQTFYIGPKSISGSNISISPAGPYRCDGEDWIKRLSITVADGGVQIQSSQYILSYYRNSVSTANKVTSASAVGTYVVLVEGQNNYTSSVSKTFVIEAADMGGAVVTLDNTSLTYNREIQKPRVTKVTLNGELLDPSEYEVTYVNASDVAVDPVNVGSYYVKVTSTVPQYEGSRKTLYRIEEATLNNIELSSYTSTWDNTSKKRTVTNVVTVNGLVLDSSEYTVAYYRSSTGVNTSYVSTEDFTSAGYIRVTVSSTNSNIVGSVSSEYRIEPRDISRLEVEGIVNKVYNREAQVQEIVIEDSIGYTLTEADYTVEYTSNVNVGQVNITIRGQGNYTGSITGKSFQIEQAVIDGVSLEEYSTVFDRSRHTPIVSEVRAGDLVLYNSEYTVSMTGDLINAGTVVVSITTNNVNFRVAEAVSAEYEINPAKISSVTLAEIGGVFNYGAHNIEVTKVSTDRALELRASEYTVKTYRIVSSSKVETTDYINAGEIYIEITPDSPNFIVEGIVSATYTISPKDISSEGVVIIYYYVDEEGRYVLQNGQLAENKEDAILTGDQTYLGQRVKPELVYLERGLVLGTDYTFSATKGGEEYKFATVGDFTLAVEGEGNFSGKITKDYEVNAAPFNETTIRLELKEGVNSKYVYTGSRIELNPDEDILAVYNQEGIDNVLKYGEDYTTYKGKIVVTADGVRIATEEDLLNPELEILDLSETNGYYNNINEGESMVVFTGDENFQNGVIVVLFNINAASEGISSSINEYESTYTGQGIEPKVTVRWTGREAALEEGVDYIIKGYKDNVNVTENAQVEIEGINNFAFTRTMSYQITARDIAEVELSKSADRVYNKQDERPSIELRYNGMLLGEEDYVARYYRGEEITNDFTNVGEIRIELEGRGNYSGRRESSYRIEQGKISRVEVSGNVIFDRTPHRPNVQVYSERGELVEISEYRIEYRIDGEVVEESTINWIDAVVVEIVIISENKNYESIEKSVRYEIEAREITLDMIISSQYEFYTGQAIEPEVEVMYSGAKLGREEYSYRYEDNTNRGIAKIYVTGHGNYKGEVVYEFTIGAPSIDQGESKGFRLEGIEDVVYDTQIHREEPRLYFNGTLLDSNEIEIDYGEGQEFRNVGTKTITIRAKENGNFVGTRVVTYEIKARKIADVKVEVSLEESEAYVYNGQGIEPQIKGVSVSYEIAGETIREELEYAHTYRDNVEASGQAKIELEASGNYEGVYTKYFTIEAYKIDEEQVGEIADVRYTGEEQRPEVEVSKPSEIGEGNLVINVDYILVYGDGEAADLKNVGVKTVSIIGRGNYQGTIVRQYEILALELKEDSIAIADSYEYTGRDIVEKIEGETEIGGQALVIEIDGLILVENEDYVVSLVGEYKNSGAKVIEIRGIGNVTGEVVKNFRIEAKAIETSMVQGVEARKYTGEEIRPELEIAYGEERLELTKDYTVEYVDNIVVGEGKAIVEGHGNYRGSIEIVFKIEARDIIETEDVTEKIYEYDGAEHRVEPVLKYNGKELTESDYILEYNREEFINVGKVEIKITGRGNYEGTRSLEYEIVPYDIKGSRVEAKIVEERIEYTGEAIEARYEIKDGERGIEDSVEVRYINNVNAGIATLIIEGRGNYSGRIEIRYEIRAQEIRDIKLEADWGRLTEKEHKIEVSFSKENEVAHHIEYYNEEGERVERLEKAGWYKVKVVIDDRNYVANGNDEVQVYIRAVKLELGNGIECISEEGFSEGTKIEVKRVEGREEIEKILGELASRVGKISYIYTIEVEGEEPKEYEIRYRVERGYRVYIVESGEIKEVEGELAVLRGAGVIILEIEAESGSGMWIGIGVAGGVVVMVGLIVTINVIQRKRKRRRLLENMSKDAIKE